MKKFMVLLTLLFIVGCSKAETINFKGDVKSITFNVGSISYDIKEDKVEDIVSVLNEQKLINGKEITEESFWSIEVYTDEVETIGIQPNGNIVLKKEETFYEHEVDNKSIYDLFTKIMGKEVFHGLLVPFDDNHLLENEWVYDNGISNIFHIDANEIEKISIDALKNNQSFIVKKDKINELVNALNSTKHFECFEGGFYGGYPARINLLFKDDSFLTIHVLNESIDQKNAIHFVLETDEQGYPIKERSYRIENVEQMIVSFKEMIGQDFFSSFNPSPSKEWLEIEE